MIVYNSTTSGSMKELKKPFPYRTEFNGKSLFFAGISAVTVVLALVVA